MKVLKHQNRQLKQWKRGFYHTKRLGVSIKYYLNNHAYFKSSRVEFPRAYYVANPNQTEEENKKNSNRIRALMLKVAKDDVRDGFEEVTNAVILGEELKLEKREKENEECYCLKMGLVEKSCNGKGKLINDNDYGKLANDMGVEKNVFKAVAKVESGGRSSFVSINPNKSKILYERHKAYRHVKKKYGKSKADELASKNSNLVHPKWSKKEYKGGKKEHERLNDAEKLIGERDIPIMSCSWGKFQVLGEYYHYLYVSLDELEKAQNLCEVQQFRYFRTYLEDVAPSIKKAMKDKNWREIARLYNGEEYEKNDYHTKMKNAYENYKNKN